MLESQQLWEKFAQHDDMLLEMETLDLKQALKLLQSNKLIKILKL